MSLELIALDAFWSALAALGFAMLFNMPRARCCNSASGGASRPPLSLVRQRWG